MEPHQPPSYDRHMQKSTVCVSRYFLQKIYEFGITHFGSVGSGQTLHVLTEECADNTLRIRFIRCFVRCMIWYRRPNLHYLSVMEYGRN